MASRHDIIHIDFQANAGKANAALEALRQESAKAKAEVDRLTKELQQKKSANFPLADIQTLEAELKKAKNVHRQWQDALNNNLKGVRALDEAIKMFNKGQGSVEGMNAALSKTAKNAAELQKSRSQKGSQTWNEMVALSKALEQNILSCNTATNQLVTTVKNGGSVSRATLTQAKSDLQQMLALENEGTSAWKKYNAQLKVVDGALTKMTVEQQQLAGKNVLAQVFRGDYITKSRSELEQMIAKLREYQSVIADPEGKGARHFNATKDAITKLSEQLQKTKGDAMNAQQAMKLAGMAGVDAKGAQFVAQQTKQKESVQQLTETLKQQQAQRANLVAQQQAEANASSRNIERFQNEANAIRAEVSALDMSTEAVARRKAELASVSAELEKQQQKEQKLQEQYAKTAAANQTSQRGVAVSNQLFTTQKEITSLSQKQATLQKEVEIVNRLREAENRLAGAQQMSTVETEKGTVVTKDYLTHLQMEVDRAKAEAASIDTSTEAMKRRKAELQTLGVQISQAQQKEKQLQDQYDRMAAHGRKGQKISKGIESTKNEIAALQQRKAVLETQISADARLQAAEEKVATAMQQAAGVAAMSGAAISHYDSQIASTTSQLNNEKAALDNLNKAENMTLQEVSQAIAVLKQEQEVTASTTAKFTEQANAIAVLEEREKIMRGEAISLADAMKLASTAGGVGFKGTATQLQQAEAALQKAVTTAKKGSPEWTKYSEALAKVRLEMQNAGMTSEKMRTILNKPVNAKNLNELQAAVKRAKAELDLMAGTVGKNSKAYTDLANKTKQAEMQLKAMQAQSKGTASAFDKAWSRLKTYIGLYVGAAVAMQKIVATMGDLMELSDKMGEVRKTTGFTADEVGRLSDNLKKLDVRTSLTSLMELSSLAGSVGLKTQEDVQGFTEAANQLMIALPEMGNESARTLIKIATATGDLKKNNDDVRETLERVGSTIIALRANSASAAPAITDFVSRVGAVGAQAGISIDQIAALGSTIDALGGRVEMSATALSRMIPAIRNNAFGVANAIGVTEKTLTDLFNQGKSMEAMVLIFQKMRESVKQFDTSTEEGMNAMADNVEALLGKNASMAEVMKELNQQGARAGIVFGLLSQNVDELQRQLGIAGKAYEKNTALLEEFNRMNDTTAAKWARFKNDIEELFLGDTGQRWLGNVIDGMRWIAKTLSSDGALGMAFKTFATAFIVLKIGLGDLFLKMIPAWITTAGGWITTFATSTMTYLTGAWTMLKVQVVQTDIATKRAAVSAKAMWASNVVVRYVAGAWAMLKVQVMQTDVATKKAAISWKAMNASMNANVVLAVVAALGFLIYKLVEWKNEIGEVAKALADAQKETFGAERAVTYLFNSLKKTEKGLEDASTAANKAEESHATLKKEVEELRKETNLSADASALLKKKEEELEEEEKKLAEEKNKVVEQESERNRLIKEINDKYSTYLGYMLNEYTSAQNVAEAHRQIVAALKEEIYQKKKLGLVESVTNKHSEAMAEYTAAAWDQLKDLPQNVQTGIMSDWQQFLDGITYEKGKGFTLSNGQTFSELSDRVLTDEFQRVVQEHTGWDMDKVNEFASSAWGFESAFAHSKLGGLMPWLKNFDDKGFRHWTKEYLRTTQEIANTEHLLDQQFSDAHGELMDTKWAAYQGNMRTLAEMQRNNRTGNMSEADIANAAQALVGMTTAITKNSEIRAEAEGGVFSKGDVNINVTSERFLAGFSKENQAAILEAAKKASKTGTGGGGSGSTKEPSPYGTFDRVVDTYDKWDADSLVARRKEMLERVRTLANGADVQAVLSEDAKFISEATRKNIKTTRDAIEWYNTERLKIQDALHEKHLTNTGDWLDPTQKKGREKTLKAEWKEYLDELDAYYTARKTKIQDARNDEMITEAEAWRRTLQNDAEWRQRRAELQQLYANKSAKVTAEETQAIYEILAEQTGESSDYIKKDIAQTVKFILAIGAKSKDEMEKLIGQIDKGTEQDFFRQRVAIGKQMDAIADIIEKERPFNGITENLQANLTKMGVLQADFEKKRLELVKKREDTSELDKEYEAEVPKRIAFLLEEAEHAYNTTIEEVVARMEKAGMTAWAGEIKNDPTMQEALMGQLHSTFDKVQEAIKKEASLWKKEAENMWNNILMPDGKTTLKQLADQVTAQLSLDANRVGRANNLIGAGQASERVVDKLAIQQMKVQLAMQQHYYNLMRERGQAAIKDLERQAALAKERGNIEEATRKELDAQHARMTLNLATTKEQTELAKQQEEIIARTEESQNRLYKELKSWAELLASSMQELFEAEHAGDREYYNERAKLALTGKGGPGAGTYVVIDNEGTSSAKAHYEYLSEEEALEREHQIEIENARAEAWKKVMDEFNEKLDDAITDQINAMLQNQSIDANTQAVIKNTEALAGMTSALGEKGESVNTSSLAGSGNLLNVAVPTGEGGEKKVITESGVIPEPIIEVHPLQDMEKEGENGFSSTSPYINSNQEGADFWQWDGAAEAAAASTESQVDSINKVQAALDHQFHQQVQGTKDTNDAIKKNTQSMFASMTAAANLYGAAYQAMVNENLDMTQKFEMIALQAVGQAAIAGLSVALSEATAKTATNQAITASKDTAEHGSILGPILTAISTAVLGGLMGLAASKITKSKAQIAQATGASAASAGKLTTGMLTYASGNINEFTDPGTLTEGRHYNVDAADGRTYRAKYMGKNAKTHITNGPEFHLVGEKGREAIIDAKTTRQIQMDDNGIWRSIQTLYNGGRISSVSRRRGRGVMAFADGNIDEFDSVDSGQLTVDSYIDIAGMQASLDRNSAVQEALLERLSKPIQAKFDVYGKGGLVDSYDTGKKTVNRHGERY